LATEIINTDVNLLRAVTIDRPAGVAPVLPALSIGEILRFSVRENPANGKGLIVLNGQLVAATLPPNLKAGDGVVAKLLSANDQVLLQILDRPKQEFTPGGVTSVPLQNLTQQLRSFSNAGLRTNSGFPILDSLRDSLNGQLKYLLQSLPTAEKLGDPKIALTQLVKAASGELALPLKEIAQALREVQDDRLVDPGYRLLVALRGELAELLPRSASDNRFSSKVLSQLISTLFKELDGQTLTKSEGRASLTQALKDLRSAAQAPADGVRAELERAFKKIETATNTPIPLKDLAVLNKAQEMQSTIGKLELLASAQENLAQLNPVMQALGEPALILFPFIAQGLLNHSQITVEPRYRKRGAEDEEVDGNGKRKGQVGENEPYQRIQVNVPLPSLGEVGVDIAHRTKEIMVRLTVTSDEVARFLLDQLEHLAVILREQGFERAELVAQVGKPLTDLPNWSLGLQSGRSVFV